METTCLYNSVLITRLPVFGLIWYPINPLSLLVAGSASDKLVDSSPDVNTSCCSHNLYGFHVPPFAVQVSAVFSSPAVVSAEPLEPLQYPNLAGPAVDLSDGVSSC